MTLRKRSIALLVLQCLLVGSIAAKYLYERATRPRVWVPAQPLFPMRGRYLELRPIVDICELTPFDRMDDYDSEDRIATYHLRLVVRDGKLVAEDARNQLPRNGFQSTVLGREDPCDRTPVFPEIDYFIRGNAKSPVPLKSGQELWVEVTVPPSGSPRPIQLALSDNGNWRVLRLE